MEQGFHLTFFFLNDIQFLYLQGGKGCENINKLSILYIFVLEKIVAENSKLQINKYNFFFQF